jgi:hypothetical protein
MIDNVFEFGYLKDATKETEMGYGIVVVWQHEDEAGKETFQGTDVQKVKNDTIDFIINHYKSTKNG